MSTMVLSARGALLPSLGSLGIGLLIGAAGTAAHRAYQPWAVIGCLALVLASAVLARAWGGMLALLAYGVGWVAVVQVLSLTGPGGDVLIPAGQVIGYGWLVGGMLAIAVAAFCPRRWFSDEVPAPTPALPGT
ncbi:hypothetical protein [Pengzhenrongella sicca]|uniref:Uncharacterized protein n=1 Tax=Pengzhenrongella sicca TaxID=2819238 RepID=A0A8A4ZBM5_9MICO|nr:hypothetical protein [Pengzhenrongella sicca]QTE28821.1 hypothetical protein J4E96_16020 [Pengzhenrongella sicca]